MASRAGRRKMNRVPRPGGPAGAKKAGRLMAKLRGGMLGRKGRKAKAGRKGAKKGGR